MGDSGEEVAVVLDDLCSYMWRNQLFHEHRCRSQLLAEYRNHSTELLLPLDVSCNVGCVVGGREALVGVLCFCGQCVFRSLIPIRVLSVSNSGFTGVHGKSARSATVIRKYLQQPHLESDRNSISHSSSIFLP